jgi:hypothetical protein
MFQRGRGLAVEKRQAPVIEVTVAGMTPPPRSKEGTQPGRISRVWNTATPTKSSLAWLRAGRPTVREAETFGGIGMSNKRMPVGESQQETGAGSVLLLQVASYRITGRIPGESGPGPKGR